MVWSRYIGLLWFDQVNGLIQICSVIVGYEVKYEDMKGYGASIRLKNVKPINSRITISGISGRDAGLSCYISI